MSRLIKVFILSLLVIRPILSQDEGDKGATTQSTPTTSTIPELPDDLIPGEVSYSFDDVKIKDSDNREAHSQLTKLNKGLEVSNYK